MWSGAVDAAGHLHLEPRTKAALAAYVRAHFKNSPVEVVIRKRFRKRSNRANAYYWGVVIAEIASCAGYRKADAYQLHDALAFKFLPLPNCPITGSPRRQRTPETDTAEFAAYVDTVIQWAAETWGVVIPEPTQIDTSRLPEQPSPRSVDREQGWGVAA